MTANNLDENPRIQHSANTMKTKSDFEPAGFITPPPGFELATSILKIGAGVYLSRQLFHEDLKKLFTILEFLLHLDLDLTSIMIIKRKLEIYSAVNTFHVVVVSVIGSSIRTTENHFFHFLIRIGF